MDVSLIIRSNLPEIYLKHDLYISKDSLNISHTGNFTPEYV